MKVHAVCSYLRAGSDVTEIGYLICNSGQVKGVGRADEDNDCEYCQDERYSTNIAGGAPAISYMIPVPNISSVGLCICGNKFELSVCPDHDHTSPESRADAHGQGNGDIVLAVKNQDLMWQF